MGSLDAFEDDMTLQHDVTKAGLPHTTNRSVDSVAAAVVEPRSFVKVYTARS